MAFLLIRIFPFILPILYFLILKILFYFAKGWYWLLILILFFDFIYFFLLNLKIKNQNILLIFLHSVIFVVVGFIYSLLLSSQLFINLFLIFWSLIYLIYLESILHYFYQTKKVFLIDLKNIIIYVNLIIFFLFFASLINFYIFFSLSWLWILLIGFIVISILLFNNFSICQFKFKIIFLYSLIIALILVEILGSLLLWPVSFYVSAAVLSLIYYLLSNFTIFHLRDGLTKRTVLQYSVFTITVLIIILATATWL